MTFLPWLGMLGIPVLLTAAVLRRSATAIVALVRSAQGVAGHGFGFTYPAGFPMARIDQIMMKGIDPVSSWSLPRTGSDHLPLAASVKI
ncbi:hypothetical protein [Streptomyces caniferus]|uniref:Endonuclease/exonuclease/phosphatase domain-containing protein n=1 Tax=Streptomyces caniferus TaxID=285557 RepID=A0A640S955_9ACTN|nr:hypothetical protein Scani_39980 [Streptomyces caniferus]